MSTIYSAIQTSGYIGSDLTINNLTYDPDRTIAHNQRSYVAIVNSTNYASTPSSLKTISLNNLPSNGNMILPTSTSFGIIQPITSTSWGSYSNVFPNGFVMLSLDENKTKTSVTYTLTNTTDSTFNLSMAHPNSPTDVNTISAILLFGNPSLPESQKIKCTYQITGQSLVPIKAASTSLTPNVAVNNPAIAGEIPPGGSIVFTLENNVADTNAKPYLFVTLTGVTYTSPKISFTSSLTQSTTYQTQNSFVPVVKALPNLLNHTLNGSSVTFTVKNASNAVVSTATGTFSNFSASPASLLAYAQLVPGTYTVSASYEYQSSYSGYIASVTTSLITLTITYEQLSPVLTVPSNVNYTDPLDFTYTISSKDEINGTLTLTIGDNKTPKGTNVYTITNHTTVTDPTNSANKLVTYSTSGLGLTAKSLNRSVPTQPLNIAGTFMPGNYVIYNSGPTITTCFVASTRGGNTIVYEDITLLQNSYYRFTTTSNYYMSFFIYAPTGQASSLLEWSPTITTPTWATIFNNQPYRPYDYVNIYSSVAEGVNGINTIPGSTNTVLAKFVPTSASYATPADITKSFTIYPVKLELTVAQMSTNSSGNAMYASAVNFTAIPYGNSINFSQIIVDSGKIPKVVFTIYNSSNVVVTTVENVFNTGTNASFQGTISTLAIGTYYVIARMATDIVSQTFSYINESAKSSSFTVDKVVTSLTVDSPNERGVYDLPLDVTGKLTGAVNYGANGSFKLYKTDDVLGTNPQPITNYNPIPVATLEPTIGRIKLATSAEDTFKLKLRPSDIGVSSNQEQLFYFKLEWSISDNTYETSSALFTIQGIPDRVVTTLACSNYVSGTSTVEDVLNFTMTVGASSDNSQDANVGLVTVYYKTSSDSARIQLGPAVEISNGGTGSPPTHAFTFKAVRDNLTSNPNITYTFFTIYQPQHPQDRSTNTNFFESTSDSVTGIQLRKAATSVRSMSLVNTTTAANTATVPINDIVKVTSNVKTTLDGVIAGNVLTEYKYTSGLSYATLFSSTAIDNMGNYSTPTFTFNVKNLPTGTISIRSAFTPTDTVNYSGSDSSITFSIVSTETIPVTASFNNSGAYFYLEDMSLTVSVVPFIDQNAAYIPTTGTFTLFNGSTLLSTSAALTFTDTSTQTINLMDTPKKYMLPVSATAYSLTLVYTPSNTNISSSSTPVPLTVKQQPLTFTLTTPTATTFLYGQNIPVTVTASSSNTSTETDSIQVDFEYL